MEHMIGALRLQIQMSLLSSAPARYRHLQPLRLCRTCRTSYSSIRVAASRRALESSNDRRKWYALGAATTIGFGLWAGNKLRQNAFKPLSPDYFIPAFLTSSEETNENAKLLHLNVPPETVARTPKTSFKPIWSIYVKDSDIQVERPYTPLEGITADGEMSFWIKRYEHGEVGRWLHRRTPGEEIEIRGPEQTWAWQEDAWDHVIMVFDFINLLQVSVLNNFKVAGGTGIAPFYQLLHTLFSDPTRTPKTKFTLLQSYCSPKELPPPMILKNLSLWESGNSQNLQVRTFVDTQEGGSEMDNFVVGRIDKDALKSALRNSSGRTIVLICGPNP